MSAEHECTSCAGTKYDGVNLTCQRCLQPYFLECIDSLPEIKELLGSLTPIAASSLKLPTNSTVKPAKTWIKVRKIINQHSVFNFTCLKCTIIGIVH